MGRRTSSDCAASWRARPRSSRAFRLPALIVGEPSENDRNQQADGDACRNNAQAPRGPPPARQQILVLERGRTGHSPGRHLRQRAFGATEIDTLQEEAPVAAIQVPLDCTHEQPRVCSHPLEIRIERTAQSVSGFCDVVRVPREDPVEPRQRGRHQVNRNVAADNRDELLAVRLRMLELVTADLRLNRVGADDEHEDVRGLDRPFDRFHERLARVDVFPIDPDVALERGEPIVKGPDQRLVGSRIRNERFRRERVLRRRDAVRGRVLFDDSAGKIRTDRTHGRVAGRQTHCELGTGIQPYHVSREGSRRVICLARIFH